MKKKIKILCYECAKCDKRVYFRSDEEYTTQCKTCKNEMIFQHENNYNPKNGLRAIEGSNVKDKGSIIPPKVECPYCHSTDTKRISVITRVFFTDASAVGKQFQCNSCSAYF